MAIYFRGPGEYLYEFDERFFKMEQRANKTRYGCMYKLCICILLWKRFRECDGCMCCGRLTATTGAPSSPLQSTAATIYNISPSKIKMADVNVIWAQNHNNSAQRTYYLYLIKLYTVMDKNYILLLCF